MTDAPRLLLIEHDQQRLVELQALLANYSRSITVNLIPAVDTLASFDLVLLNPAVPGLKIASLAAVPIVFLRSTPYQKLPKQALVWDVIDYPFDADVLLNRLENLRQFKVALTRLGTRQQAWSQFLRTLSHDLRTPMATIGVTLSSIQRMLTKKPAAEIAPKLDKIRRALDRQITILEAAQTGQGAEGNSDAIGKKGSDRP